MGRATRDRPVAVTKAPVDNRAGQLDEVVSGFLRTSGERRLDKDSGTERGNLIQRCGVPTLPFHRISAAVSQQE